jgi:hypothetical protein
MVRSSVIMWSGDLIRYFIYRLHSRFTLLFNREGLEQDSFKFQAYDPEFWNKAMEPQSDQKQQVFTFLSRLIRVPHLLRSLDFRVFVDIDSSGLQSREPFNGRTMDSLEKINGII